MNKIVLVICSALSIYSQKSDSNISDYFENSLSEKSNVYYNAYTNEPIQSNYFLNTNYTIDDFETYLPISPYDLDTNVSLKSLLNRNSIRETMFISTKPIDTKLNFVYTFEHQMEQDPIRKRHYFNVMTQLFNTVKIYSSIDLLEDNTLNRTSIINTPIHLKSQNSFEHVKYLSKINFTINDFITDITWFKNKYNYQQHLQTYVKNNAEHQPRHVDHLEFYGIKISKQFGQFNISLKSFLKKEEKESGDGVHFNNLTKYQYEYGHIPEHSVDLYKTEFGAGIFEQSRTFFDLYTKSEHKQKSHNITATLTTKKHNISVSLKYDQKRSNKYSLSPLGIYDIFLRNRIISTINSYTELTGHNYGYDLYGNKITREVSYNTEPSNNSSPQKYLLSPEIGYTLLSGSIEDEFKLSSDINMNVGVDIENYSYIGLKTLKDLHFDTGQGNLLSLEHSNFKNMNSVTTILPNFGLQFNGSNAFNLDLNYSSTVLYPDLETYYFKSWKTLLDIQNNATHNNTVKSLIPEPVKYNKLVLASSVLLSDQNIVNISLTSLNSKNELSKPQAIFGISELYPHVVQNKGAFKHTWFTFHISSKLFKHVNTQLVLKKSLQLKNDMWFMNTEQQNSFHLNPFGYNNSINKDHFRRNELLFTLKKDLGFMSIKTLYQWKSGYNYTSLLSNDIIKNTVLLDDVLPGSELTSPSISQLNISLDKDIEISSIQFNLKLSVTNVLDKTNELIVYHDSGKASNTNHLNTNQGEGDVLVNGARYASNLGISQEEGEKMYISDRTKRENNPYHYERPREIVLSLSLNL